MFIGHYAPAFAAAVLPRSARSRLNLGTLFVAAQLVDLGFFSLLILGVEHLRMVPNITVMNPMDLYYMPFTHSLVGAVVWGVAFALVIRAWRGNWAAATIGGVVVVSHWVLDLLVHRPDLTIAGAPPKLGLGLWNHPWVEIPLELAFAFGGLWFYVSRTRPSGAPGQWSPWVLATAMAVFQAINWATPQPDTITPAPPGMGWLALFAYLTMAALAWWVAQTRRLA